MSVIPEIRKVTPQLTPRRQGAKRKQSKTLGLMRDPDLTAVLAFVVVGLLLSIWFPLSADMATQFAQIP
jgi:hypothetical protein